eukprot:CAMPEP_0185034896 /NCGR_PEP_ID=MMETSP1103-20130426/25281_1 /TAXON_ID=36769 /ORGANISM="Paraphysomonas bandaiensis, Strain Caron Lab Isolate" /LENGTH=142 /DNA_ID=CAMNT_0027571737 /DNA_START=163 /DNA_END=591 /DNA_ORIENTATION=+
MEHFYNSKSIDRSALMTAYSTKKDMQTRTQEQTTVSGSRSRILTPSTAKRHPLKSEGHRAGDISNDAQRRLARKDMYTGIQKMRFDSKANLKNGSGDICASPTRAARLLNSRPCKQLGIPARTGDFRNEVEWRLQLRPQFNY